MPAHRYPGDGRRAAAITALRADPATSEPMAMPRMRLSTAVATFDAVLSFVVNGASTMPAVTSAATQPKNRIRRGVNRSSTRGNPGAAGAAAAAAPAGPPVGALPPAPLALRPR